MTLLKERKHPAFQRKPGSAVVKHNTMLDLTEAAAYYGLAVLDADLDTQAMLVAGMQIRRAIDAMLSHDATEARKREAERKRASNPKKRRR